MADADAKVALQDSSRSLDAILNNTKMAIFMMDERQQCVFMNKAAEEMTGYSFEETRGRPLHDVIHHKRPDGRPYPLAECPIDRAFPEENQVQGEEVFVHKDGHFYPVAFTASPIRNAAGEPIGTVIEARNIGGERARDLALRTSEARLRSVFENAGVGMIEIDSDWKILSTNPAYRAITGYSAEELMRTNCLAFTYPEDVPRCAEAMQAIAEDDVAGLSLEKRYLRSDGTTVWVRSNLTKISGTGEAPRFLKIVEDINSMKQAEGRNAALVELSDRFRELDDPADLAYAAAEILGNTLRVSRAGYGNIDVAAETITIERDWNAPGIQSLAGTLHFRDYGSYIEDLKRGETVVFADAEKDPRTASTADALKAISAQAVVNMPVTEEDGPVALLYLNHATAREWSEDELNFIRNVAERTRSAVERKRAERRLREESHNLEVLNRTGAAIAGELDLEKVVQLVTDAGVELTGAHFGAFFYNVVNAAGESYTLYTISGVPRSEFEKFPMPRNTKVFAPTFSGEGVVRSDDIRADPRYGQNDPYYGMPKGHLPVVSYLAVPVTSRNGEVLGGLFFGHPDVGRFKDQHEKLMQGIAAQAAIAIDNARLYRAAQHEIDQRVKAEQALTALNETLESSVAEEIARRSRAEEVLRQAQKMETVGQLSGGIAHDFNNLLQVIHGNISLLQRAIPTDDERLQRALGNALTGTDRAAALTKRLLAFSRRQPLAAKPTDVNNLIDEMTELLHRTIGETINIKTHLAADIPPALVDANQLENAILNLAINARDAMPNGGKLDIMTDVTELEEETLAERTGVRPGCYVCIAVRDNGFGMSEQVLARAVEPFFSTKEVGQGTGLGLSTVYGFVRQSGGQLLLHSREGSGTTVEILLPCASAEVADGPGETSAELPKGHGELVLLCEDDEGVRLFSGETLRDLGYKVVEAGDAASALAQLAETGRIDLLFTDVVLPGGQTGADLAREARKLQPDLKVLFTTGYARSALDKEQEGAKGIELLLKPFGVEQLATKLREMLD